VIKELTWTIAFMEAGGSIVIEAIDILNWDTSTEQQGMSTVVFLSALRSQHSLS
tara:strand:+ start:9660 stop:9821 length:162 start_codon:yes stop_codon:yes gene_type:complete